MPKLLVPDELWAGVEPLLPRESPKLKGGRPRVPDRAAPAGILFVLKTGTPWEMLPREMNCGSGMTCWRRLKEWHEAGVWERLHKKLLDRLGEADLINRGLGPRSTRRRWLPPGGEKTGPHPADRGKQGSKRHLVVDGGGVPLAVRHTGPTSTTRRCSKKRWMRSGRYAGHGDGRGNGPRSCTPTRATTSRAAARHFGSAASRAASRGVEASESLGRHRWVVERTPSWLNCYRRLKARYERREAVREAFLDLGCALICWNHVQRFC